MNKKILFIVDFIVFSLLVFFDRITKNWMVANLKGKDPIVLIDGVFELQYLENRGAAFGMLQNARVFFVLAACILFFILLFVLHRVPNEKKYLPWHMFCVLLGAGGLGNLIDRLQQAFVVDFFYFKCIDFPIFNVADIYVTIGTFWMVFFVIWKCKEEDLSFLTRKG